jgi:hypothetical protein
MILEKELRLSDYLNPPDNNTEISFISFWWSCKSFTLNDTDDFVMNDFYNIGILSGSATLATTAAKIGTNGLLIDLTNYDSFESSLIGALYIDSYNFKLGSYYRANGNYATSQLLRVEGTPPHKPKQMSEK